MPIKLVLNAVVSHWRDGNSWKHVATNVNTQKLCQTATWTWSLRWMETSQLLLLVLPSYHLKHLTLSVHLPHLLALQQMLKDADWPQTQHDTLGPAESAQASTVLESPSPVATRCNDFQGSLQKHNLMFRDYMFQRSRQRAQDSAATNFGLKYCCCCCCCCCHC